jgi:arylsulfatase A-like enzyme
MRQMLTVLFLILAAILGTGCGEPDSCAMAFTCRPNIILISIDALRADHLGCYNYERATSPVLDSLAATGTRFANCQSQAPWTLPSHASLFTGLTARSHGAGISDESFTGLDPDLASLPVVLLENGYGTFGLANFTFLSPMFGFSNGFSFYTCHTEDRAVDAGRMIEQAMDIIDANAGKQAPFFLFLHLMDVHSPYLPPAPYDTMFTKVYKKSDGFWPGSIRVDCLKEWKDFLLSQYDGDIANTDAQLGRLFGYLRKLGIAESTLIIVVSDHGDSFLDHRTIEHSTTLYQELLHVPLIVSGPGIPVRVAEEPVGLFDVFPSILGYLGLSVQQPLEGTDIFTQPLDARRIIPSGEILDRFVDSHMVAVRRGDDKLFLDAVTGKSIMFNLFDDPLEMHPVPVSDEMVEAAMYYWSTPPLGHPEPVDDLESMESIRSLGYLL